MITQHVDQLVIGGVPGQRLAGALTHLGQQLVQVAPNAFALKGSRAHAGERTAKCLVSTAFRGHRRGVAFAGRIAANRR
jgi:hypothetical protein